MKPRSMIVIFVTAALMLACNAPFLAAPQVQPTIQSGGVTLAPSETPGAAAAASSAASAASSAPAAGPTDTVAPVPTDTPSAPMVTPIKDPVNCRFGPAATYEGVGAGLAVGSSTQVLGKNTDGSWLQIAASGGKGDKCWVSTAFVTLTGDLSQVGVVAAPAAFVTGITLVLKPTVQDLKVTCPGPAKPVNFTGTISANGPELVQWYFETQQGGKMSTHSTSFTTFGTKTVTGSYTPPLKKGTFWVHLVIISPNNMMIEADYQVKCG